ncbi:hypothetical protein OG394_33265 [Kribbella sp. NBC_01245]|uniref:hypothetical protein n=1 Tax=Kribbella sp. NBC_01245 TaxID=2903578 RepID=UPI002E29ABA2|nr:hypothetical protein [Kribbella sp. NBC_01245]
MAATNEPPAKSSDPEPSASEPSAAKMPERSERAFGFTPAEETALAALAAGLSTLTTGLAGRPLPVSDEDAVIAAIEHALSRMIEDYEVPDPTIRAQVTTARNNLRTHWTRGAASM